MNSMMVGRAIQLHEAGWSVSEVRELLDVELGVRPCKETIRTWVDPAYRVRRREQHARQERRRRGGPTPLLRVSEGLRVDRMRALHERGVGLRAIGQVAAVWWGEELSGAQVRDRLGLEHDQRFARGSRG